MKALLTTVLLLGSALTASASTAPQRCPELVPPTQDPADQRWYDFVMSYRTACSAQHNDGRPLADVTVSTLVDGRVPLTVTTSTALAGAIGSLKVAGKEYIDSGGHGSALQYAFHAWTRGAAESECYNPTQAGARVDDRDALAPFHEPSTSKVLSVTRNGSTSVGYTSQPAMFITLDDPAPGYDQCRAAQFQPAVPPFTEGRSKATLTASVHVGADNGLAGLENVVKLAATYATGDLPHEEFDAVLIAYLQRDFTAKYTYDNGALAPRGRDDSSAPPVRCTATGDYCLGLYFAPRPRAYYYTMDRSTPNSFSEQTTQVTVPSSDIPAGGSLHYETYLAVGNKDRVAWTLGELARRVG